MDLKLEPQYIPRINQLKSFNDYQMKYMTYMNKQIENNKNESNSLLSSYEDDDDKDIDYDPNWANNF